jgi:hypothetical protein
VCQRKFQPIIANASDPKATKYYNFTFNEDQYYKCPSKDNPYIGLLSGYHPNGFCLPCCRKQVQSNQKTLTKSCISGKLTKQDKILSKNNNHYYIIDYPGDMAPNTKIIARISNIPDSINKMLTKGTKLLVNGISIEYSEQFINFQILHILKIYLNKKNIREVVLMIIEYLQDISNRNKLLKMPSIVYTFNNFSDLLSGINQTFMKKTTIVEDKNWNDVFIDIAICMNINIVLLIDNRLKSSDCSNVINNYDGCSTEPLITENSNLKLEKLEYADLSNPVLMILKRIDTEYSKQNSNRRYHYFPIISNNIIEPNVIPVLSTTIEQLIKIKNITEEPVTNIISKSFDYESILALSSKKIQVISLYSDINENIAYAEVSCASSKILLVSLYRTPVNHNIKIEKFKLKKYTASYDQALSLIEEHNNIQLKSLDIVGFHEYLKTNINSFVSHDNIIQPDTKEYLLKVDKFIIYNKLVIGIKFNAINKKTVAHSIIVYHDPTTISKLMKTTKEKISKYAKNSITKNDAKMIAGMPLDMICRTESIIYNTKELENSEYAKYFIEYLQNPKDLINTAPSQINYEKNNTYKQGQYMSSIYRLMINKFIEHWSQSRPTNLLNAIEKLVNDTNPGVLKIFSNNLIEDWVDKLCSEFGNIYHPNIIRAEFLDLMDYVKLNIRSKTKKSIIQILSEPSLPINDIEIHNLAYTSRSNIEKLVNDTANLYLLKVDSVPIDEPYTNKSGKLLVLRSIYSDLINLAISDLSNQFRREYVVNNCLLNSFDNRTKLKSHLDELIYIQEL